MAADDPFPTAALPTNRSGRLTDEQAYALREMARQRRLGVRRGAWVPTVIGLLILLFGDAPEPTRMLFGLGALAVAAMMVLLPWNAALLSDARDGRVESIEGAIAKRSVHTASRRRDSTMYFIDIAPRHLRTTRQRYEAAPDAGIVRAYFLPRTQRLVNLELLPDRPLPQGPDVPRQLMKEAAAALRSGDATAFAEVRATAAAFGHAVTGPEPAPGDRSEPLTSDALAGSWTNPLMSVTFAPDGVATVAPVIGSKRFTVRWSIDADGHLSLEMNGQRERADASLHDNRLTISIGGQRLMLTRTGRA